MSTPERKIRKGRDSVSPVGNGEDDYEEINYLAQTC